MNKKDAIALAKQYNWTEADANRAFFDENIKSATEQDILILLAKFAGPELKTRQTLQAAQKGQATRAAKGKRLAEEELEKHLKETAQKFEEMNSIFIPLIEKLYGIAQRVGLKDPWIEALINMYKGFQDDQDQPA
ncbi:hypothetical protein [Gloeothece verrucosa]|uniref:Uncharacterized protein n=1 Tax=Gloeothece verrucosa (strain PCC 7822) TaxID=497965 RepID=E0ULX7_GLOV7|nr:hypothetical protein [Gloeothece verrucosa]ADN17957.1 conserved hypothetical protein [Gloeothece verrucosa PCC 7822]